MCEKELQMFEQYLRNVKNRSEKTIYAYLKDCQEFFDVFNEYKDIQIINKSMIESKYITFLVEKGNSASSRARKISSLRTFFKWAVSNNIIVENPVENVEMPKLPMKKPKVMETEEVNCVMNSVKSCCGNIENFRDFTLLNLMFNTGIRRAEVTGIKLQDINLQEGSIVIHGKGNKERIVYFNANTMAILNEYIVSHRNLLKPSKKSQYLFVTERSEKMSERAVNYIVDKYFEMAGVKSKGYTAHSTRKVFATTVYQNTKDIVTVQNLLGHSNVQTTMHYVGASEAMKRKAALTVNF